MTDNAARLSSEGSEGAIDPETVASRADGRPAEEQSSDNPEAQAQVILEESEQRIADGAHASSAPIDELIPKPSDGQLEEEGAD